MTHENKWNPDFGILKILLGHRNIAIPTYLLCSVVTAEFSNCYRWCIQGRWNYLACIQGLVQLILATICLFWLSLLPWNKFLMQPNRFLSNLLFTSICAIFFFLLSCTSSELWYTFFCKYLKSSLFLKAFFDHFNFGISPP